MGGKSNHLCLWQDIEIQTGCSGDKYGIAIQTHCKKTTVAEASTPEHKHDTI